jgi:putative ABC transport system ATP-binding protein
VAALMPALDAATGRFAAAPPAQPVVELQDLRFGWPGAAVPLLDIPQLRLDAGETLFLHGESGSGKSTLLALLAGVLLPQSGQVRLLGSDWSDLPSSRRDRRRADHVGIVFQQFNLLGYLPVLDNVLLPCRFSPRRAERASARDGDPAAAARRLLQRMGLAPDLWARPASRLSVGQQQRAAACRALIGRPALVVADEPTSALDADRQRAFLDLLRDECAEAGAALLFVSHDQRLADRFDRQLSMRQLNLADLGMGAA